MRVGVGLESSIPALIELSCNKVYEVGVDLESSIPALIEPS